MIKYDNERRIKVSATREVSLSDVPLTFCFCFRSQADQLGSFFVLHEQFFAP